MSPRLDFEIQPSTDGSAWQRLTLERAAELPAQLDLGKGSEARELFPANLTADGGLTGCLACGHPELFTQKDFPRSLGITIVVLAAVAAPWTNYLSLVVAALLDLALYKLAPDIVICYVCEARHRDFATVPRHPAFDREIFERLRFGEKAVMGKPMRPGGTAGAPDPEH